MSIVERERVTEAPAVSDADVLERAADLLEEFGWCQGSCAISLEGTATYQGWLNGELVDGLCMGTALIRAGRDLGREILSPFDSYPPFDIDIDRPVAVWNDEPGRTREEVVARLRDAAAAARQQT